MKIIYCLLVCHIDIIIKIYQWHPFKYLYILISWEPYFRILLNYFHCHFLFDSYVMSSFIYKHLRIFFLSWYGYLAQFCNVQILYQNWLQSLQIYWNFLHDTEYGHFYKCVHRKNMLCNYLFQCSIFVN